MKVKANERSFNVNVKMESLKVKYEATLAEVDLNDKYVDNVI